MRLGFCLVDDDLRTANFPEPKILNQHSKPATTKKITSLEKICEENDGLKQEDDHANVAITKNTKK